MRQLYLDKYDLYFRPLMVALSLLEISQYLYNMSVIGTVNFLQLYSVQTTEMAKKHDRILLKLARVD